MDTLIKRDALKVYELLEMARKNLEFTISQEHFEAVMVYRKALLDRRLSLQQALEEALEELKMEESRIDSLLGPRLITYARSALEGKPSKQLATRAGVVKVRKLPDRLTVTSTAQVLNWADTQLPDAVSRKAIITDLSPAQEEAVRSLVEEGIVAMRQLIIDETPKITVLRNHLKKTGEIPPGTDHVAGGSRLYMKGAKGDEVVGEQTVGDDPLLALSRAAAQGDRDGPSGEDAGAGAGSDEAVPPA